MPEPLWRGKTIHGGLMHRDGRWRQASGLSVEGLGVPNGTGVVVLTAEHYESIELGYKQGYRDGMRHGLVDPGLETGCLPVTMVRQLYEAAKAATPLAEVIAELGLTQEEIDGADDE